MQGVVVEEAGAGGRGERAGGAREVADTGGAGGMEGFVHGDRIVKLNGKSMIFCILNR